MGWTATKIPNGGSRDVKGLAAKGHISVQNALRPCNLRRIAIPGRQPWLVETLTEDVGIHLFHPWRHPKISKRYHFWWKCPAFFLSLSGTRSGVLPSIGRHDPLLGTFSHGRCINIRTGGPLETGWISPEKATTYQYPTYQNNLRCLTQKITKSTNIHHFQVPSIPKKWWFHHFQRNGAL